MHFSRQQASFGDTCEPHHLPLPHPAFSNLESQAVSQEHFDMTKDHEMAQPLLQRQFRPDDRHYHQVWSVQRNMSRQSGQSPSISATGAFDDATTSFRPLLWNGDARSDESLVWTQGLPTDPLVVQNTGFRLQQDGHLSYNGFMSAQSSFGKNGIGYQGGMYWDSRQVSTFDGSDFDTTASSLSPKSLYSELPEQVQPLVPVKDNDIASPNNAWPSLEMASIDIKRSDSEEPHSCMMSSFDSRLTRPIRTTCVDSSNAQHASAAILSSVEQAHVSELSRGPALGGSFFQDEASSAASWQRPGFRVAPGLPYYQRKVVSTSLSSGLNAEASLYEHTDAPTPGRTYDQGDRYYDAKSNIQFKYEVDRVAVDQAQRNIEDNILLEGKAAGLTYKEIRRKLGTKVAESTLRGRYRALTKAKRDRVRKPKWEAKDITLLKEVVTSQLDDLDDSCQALSQGQRLAKVSWKRVGEYIVHHGGSYHFGNSTCKKKWAEIEPQR